MKSFGDPKWIHVGTDFGDANLTHLGNSFGSLLRPGAAQRDPALATDGSDAPGIVVRQVVHPRPTGQLEGHGHIPRQGSKAGGGRAAI